MDKSFEWIKSAISTSTSQFHLDCCEVLVELFAKKYAPSGEDCYNLLLQDLRDKRTHFSPDA